MQHRCLKSVDEDCGKVARKHLLIAINSTPSAMRCASVQARTERGGRLVSVARPSPAQPRSPFLRVLDRRTIFLANLAHMLLQHCMGVLRRLPLAIYEVSLAYICVAQPGPMSIYCSDTGEHLC